MTAKKKKLQNEDDKSGLRICYVVVLVVILAIGFFIGRDAGKSEIERLELSNYDRFQSMINDVCYDSNQSFTYITQSKLIRCENDFQMNFYEINLTLKESYDKDEIKKLIAGKEQ